MPNSITRILVDNPLFGPPPHDQPAHAILAFDTPDGLGYETTWIHLVIRTYEGNPIALICNDDQPDLDLELHRNVANDYIVPWTAIKDIHAGDRAVIAAP